MFSSTTVTNQLAQITADKTRLYMLKNIRDTVCDIIKVPVNASTTSVLWWENSVDVMRGTMICNPGYYLDGNAEMSCTKGIRPFIPYSSLYRIYTCILGEFQFLFVFVCVSSF